MKFLSVNIFLFLISIKTFSQTPEWISFFNGPTNQSDMIENVTFDNTGNIYLSGYGFETSGGQGYDFFTVKCNSSGNEVWQKVYNGPQNKTDRPFGLFIDENGNVYVTGTSRWNSNTNKIVTLKYSYEGNLLWICVFDSLGPSSGEAHDIWVDNDGNVFITGSISPQNNGYYDMVTIKLNANGNILDYAYYGLTLSLAEDGTNIITDNSGNIYVGGHKDNSTFGQEAVIIKYNSELDTLWTVRINGTNNNFNEFTIEISLDDTNNLYALCRLQNSPGFTDFAVLKINPNGNVIWRTEFDEAGGQDIPEAMTMDNSGNIYVTGRVRRTGGGGYNDFAVIKYNNAGEQQWISYYDGPNNLDDDPVAINLDDDGNIYVCGESNRDGNNFSFTVVKYNQTGDYQWEYVYNDGQPNNSKAIGLWNDNSGFIYAAGEAESSNGNYDLIAVKLSKTTNVGFEGDFPKTLILFQNYPNPFNPSTKIRFAIPASSLNPFFKGEGTIVSLKVYDLLGNEIATLVNEEMPAGEYEIEFSSHSDGNKNLSSGVYFYQLKSGNYVETKKMVFLK